MDKINIKTLELGLEIMSLGHKFEKEKKSVKRILNRLYNMKIGEMAFNYDLSSLDKILKYLEEKNNLDGVEYSIYHHQFIFPDKRSDKGLVSPCIILSIDDSYLKFVVFDETIYLASIQVSKQKRRQGVGSRLVKKMEKIVSEALGFEPKYELVCTGENNFEIFGLKNQTAFFRKFGYKVIKSRSNYPTYVTLVKPKINKGEVQNV